ncbi:unnamed protein product [Mytilus edulis]|nr:unnamed protein product [Mytilus edulis]
MANYYRRFIKDHSKIVFPLNSLLHKDQPVKLKWTPKCQTAFDTIKHALVNAPVLSYPDLDKPFILTCDASDTAIAFVLGQLNSDNKEYAIAYGNKSLTKEERNYTTSEKECLAILKGVETFRPYLANSAFTVITDHNALVWLKSAKHTGKSNVVADCLSRVPNPFRATQIDTGSIPIQEQGISSFDSIESHVSLENLSSESDDEVQFGAEVHFYYASEHATDCQECPIISAVDTENIQNIVEDKPALSELQKQCPEFSAIYTYLESGDLPEESKHRDNVVSESKYFSLSDSVLFHWYQKRCRGMDPEFRRIKQIALPKSLRLEALQSYHDSLAAGGHFGIDKVNNSLIQKYWWKSMHQDITDYVKSCDRCQRAKQNCNPNRPLLPRCPKLVVSTDGI